MPSQGHQDLSIRSRCRQHTDTVRRRTQWVKLCTAELFSVECRLLRRDLKPLYLYLMCQLPVLELTWTRRFERAFQQGEDIVEANASGRVQARSNGSNCSTGAYRVEIHVTRNGLGPNKRCHLISRDYSLATDEPRGSPLSGPSLSSSAPNPSRDYRGDGAKGTRVSTHMRGEVPQVHKVAKVYTYRRVRRLILRADIHVPIMSLHICSPS